jgi:tetratricopeptide (TPR) repeat protein
MRYLFIVGALLILMVVAFADTVITTDGRRIQGKIIEKTDEHVVVKTKFGEIKIPKEEIDRIEPGEEPEPPQEPPKPKSVEEPKGDPIENLIAKLTGDNEKESQSAKEELVALGTKAVEPLKKALEKSQKDSIRTKIEDTLARIDAKLKEQKKEAAEHYVNACKIIKEWEASVEALRKEKGKLNEEELKKLYQKAYDAAKELEKACELDPDNAEWLSVLATLYYRLKNYKEALPKVKTLLQKEPDNLSLLGTVASCYIHLGQYAEAEKYLLKILSKEPQNKVALLNLGIAYLQQQKYKKCAEAFEMAIAAGEDAAFVHHYLGVANEQLDKKDKAVEEFKKAIDKDPKFDLAYRSLGHLYAQMGKNSEAVENLEKYLQLKPDASDVAAIRKMIEDLKKSK